MSCRFAVATFFCSVKWAWLLTYRLLLGRPAGLSRVARDPLAFSLTHFLCPRLPAHPAKRYSGSILAVIGDRVLDLDGRDPHDVGRVADHVAGAALAFGASGHTSTLRCLAPSIY